MKHKPGESICEHISKHVSGGNVSNLKERPVDAFANGVMSCVNMLRSRVVKGIFRQCLSTAVVNKKNNW